MLEEIGFDYKVTKLDLSKGDQFKEFLSELNYTALKWISCLFSVILNFIIMCFTKFEIVNKQNNYKSKILR